jgi:hypothetical protein
MPHFSGSIFVNAEKYPLEDSFIYHVFAGNTRYPRGIQILTVFQIEIDIIVRRKPGKPETTQWLLPRVTRMGFGPGVQV